MRAAIGDDGLPLQGWRRTFSSLSGNRDFTFLFAGNIGFFFGMQMMMILSGWLVIHRWDNAAYLGYVLASAAIPMLVLVNTSCDARLNGMPRSR